MIRYALTCDQEHQFESWFQSAAAFDKLLGAGHVACSICGSGEVKKTLMAPQVSTRKDRALEPVLQPSDAVSAPPTPAPAPHPGMLSEPTGEMEAALKAFRTEVEKNSEDVGDRFATEARKMHDGETEKRSIIGQAGLQEAKSLLEDGIPVMPLPFRPTRKVN